MNQTLKAWLGGDRIMLRVAQLLNRKTVALVRTIGLGGDQSSRRVARPLRLRLKVAARRAERKPRMGSLQRRVLESVHRLMRTGMSITL